MKGQIKIRYRLHCEDWAEDVCPYDSEEHARRILDDIGVLLFPILKKRSLELNGVHMVMKQAIFNRLAYASALECVDIGESLEMMKEFNILWFGKRYYPVYLQFPKESVPEEPVPDDPMIMF